MQCIYFDQTGKACRILASGSAPPYKPNPDEIRKHCGSNRFLDCPRLKALHENLSALVTDEQCLVTPNVFQRSLLLAKAKQLVKALSPREDLAEEFSTQVDAVLFDQLQSTFRQDFDIRVSLSKMRFASESLAAKVNIELSYDVHNLTDSHLHYRIPMVVTVPSFVDQGVPLEDHISVSEVTASVADGDTVTDLIKKCNVHLTSGLASNETKVRLSLDGKIVQTIPPANFIKIHLKYSYLGQLFDAHIQRISQLTRNVNLTLDYKEDDFLVNVDAFCTPLLGVQVPGHSYAWNGWLLPFNGFCVEWKPVWIVSSFFEKMKKRERENEHDERTHTEL